MELHKYGICLSRLAESDIELVRTWRNADHVRPYMHYQEMITPNMQQNWFRGLDPLRNFYFMILAGDKKIGLVNLKDVEYENGTAEAGIFIGDTAFLNTYVPVLATVAMMEFAFDVLGLKTLRAKINSVNGKVIGFNKSIGYKPLDDADENTFRYYTTDQTSFLEATATIRTTLKKMDGGRYSVKIRKEERDALLTVLKTDPSHWPGWQVED